ncbi:protein of unknown function DUF81 [Gemmatirosa kalamazoonensis]|uniref:Probable membrane transporter protein n=1 Tax=Gemmatirosa kalamazoonensis TaxID=861299 RepID=W0RFB4_9BACT|nr:sulfite exporter TauE/SafE family protein [Gemmatirosa kalamazoonensis]AHG89486.1 protein of unknown function DUF81 [Gemmatirosa kalamazoonensis]
MSAPLFALLVFVGSLAAGLLGALTGIGGGIVIVPMLTTLFHVDLRYAIGASLVSIIATSSGAAAAYVREGWTNVRVGILLEVGTTIGALGGAAIAPLVPTSALSILLGVVLLLTTWRSLQAPASHDTDAPSHPWARRLRLESWYPTPSGPRAYGVQAVPVGFSLMFLAGVFSALLGIGSGVLKVLAMDRYMKLPLKVSTTTSNFMIGVTAAASAGVYLHRGYILPEIAAPVMLGVLAGAMLGARLLGAARTRALRLLFNGVVIVLAVQMLYAGVRGLP